MTQDDDNDGYSEPDPADMPGDFEDLYDDEEEDENDEPDEDDNLGGSLGTPPSRRDQPDDDPWASVKSEDQLRQDSATPPHEAESDDDEDRGTPPEAVGEEPPHPHDQGGEEVPFKTRLRDKLSEFGYEPTDLAGITTLSTDEAGRIRSGAVVPTETVQQRILHAIEDAGPKQTGPDGSSSETDPDRDRSEERASQVAADQQLDNRDPQTPVGDLGGETYGDDATSAEVAEATREAGQSEPPSFEDTVPSDASNTLRAAAAQLDMMEELQGFDGDLSDVEIIAPNTSCANCSHRHTCVILSSFAPKLADENWDAGTGEEGSPIDPMDFAAICDAYDPEGDGHAPAATTE